MFVTRNVWMKYRNPTDGDGNDLGGGGAGDGKGGDDGKGGEGAAGDDGDKGGDGKGGKTGPSDEEARLLKENMKKKEELRKTQDELATLKKSIEGIDLDSVRKLLADQKTAEEKQLEAKGDYDRLKQRMADEHSKQVKTLQDQIEALQGELGKSRGTINELSIGSQFGQSKFILDELTLTPAKARVVYGDHFDLEDGKVVGYDKPRGQAGRTALVDQYGNAVGFDDAIRKIVDADPDKDHLYKSKVRQGADSGSKRVTTTTTTKEPTDSISRISSGLKSLKIS